MSARIGVISDTHGLIRREALEALKNSELIVHAGDVGSPKVLAALREIAPVIGVRGNNDKGEWVEALPPTKVVELGELHLYLLHDINSLDLDPAAAGFHAVVSGHSHRPKIEEKEGVLYFNPGSAGPRRFKLPISVGRMMLLNGKLRGEIIELKI